MTHNEQAPGESAHAACAPEWCETGAEPHGDVCDNAPMETMTKREFVDAQRAAAEHAIDAYIVMLGEDWMSADQRKEAAVDDVDEAATCWAGIGSCGRGWCQHG